MGISTQASIREMMLPGVYAIFTPVFVGFLIGARMLMGVLAGSVGAGAMLAIMMANAGGAWDNSKKYIEIAGAKGGKGTDTHKACVVGDTVGDPFQGHLWPVPQHSAQAHGYGVPHNRNSAQGPGRLGDWMVCLHPWSYHPRRHLLLLQVHVQRSGGGAAEGCSYISNPTKLPQEANLASRSRY